MSDTFIIRDNLLGGGAIGYPQQIQFKHWSDRKFALNRSILLK
jgi:hypothetical protein